MKIVHKNETQEFKNSDQCWGVEYPLGDKNINGSIGIIKGRYPGRGRAVNTKCKELVYILSGSGRIEVEKKKYPFVTGDMLLISVGERYFWEGKFEALMICVPAWYPEQHRLVE